MTIHAPLPSPIDLGFPDKFRDWYPEQIEAIDRCLFNDKRFTAEAVPTGAGKSLIGVTAAFLHPQVKRALYLTSTKGLQDQAAGDFVAMGLVDVRGARNYQCDAVQIGGHLDHYRRGRWTLQCDEGPCRAGVRCDLAPVRTEPHRRPSCQYYGALFDARRAQVVLTNYAMYFAQTEYGQGLGDFDLLILDEAHDAEKELESALTIELSAEMVKRIGATLVQSLDLDQWRAWAEHHGKKLGQVVEAREAFPPQDAEGVKDLQHLKRLHGLLVRLAAIEPLEWVLDFDGMRARIAPLKVSTYAESTLFRNIPHVLLLSATMTRKTTQLLGINPDQLMFWECPSRFALARRPIMSIETMPEVRVGYTMTTDDKHAWVNRIDHLIEPRRALGYKGLIHTVSYARMKELLAWSEHRDIMITHDSANTRETVQQFKRATGPCILVSPSIVTGYDFPDDECRFNIIGKVPQMQVKDPIMQARKAADEEYPLYMAMQKLVQAAGRGMRGPNDWCETFIVDDHFYQWFMRRAKKHAPKWFMAAIEHYEQYPEPMTAEQFTC